jgi:hypothetical protein
VVSSGFLVARRRAPELLELADAAFDEMPLSMEMPVERQAAGAGGVGYSG